MDLSILDRMKKVTGEPLMQFQKDAVLQMVKRHHNLLADEPGLGKTAQAIALWEVLKFRRILVVTKASLKRGFKKHIDDWQLTKRVIQIVDKKTDFISDLSEIVIVNYDIISHSYLHMQLTSIQWDLLICDESHALRGIKTNRTKAVLAKNGLCRHATRTLLMTGTPILNRPVELYPMLKVLAPKVLGVYDDYFKFGKRYCDGFNDGFSFNVSGASHTDELNLKLREHYMIRRTTNEVNIQLPQRRYEMVFLDKTPETERKLRIISDAQRHDFSHSKIRLQAGELATLRRETAETKLAANMDLIRDYVEACPKLVIFAYHKSVIEKLEKDLGEYGCVTLSGSTSQAERTRSLEHFQNERTCKVFIGQIQAAGEGIDGLQDVCSNVLFVESSWVPGEIEQAIKRVHRLGQKEACLIRFLVWADSIEEHMLRIALDKVKVIREITK